MRDLESVRSKCELNSQADFVGVRELQEEDGFQGPFRRVSLVFNESAESISQEGNVGKKNQEQHSNSTLPMISSFHSKSKAQLKMLKAMDKASEQ